jgi:hypothetical protein
MIDITITPVDSNPIIYANVLDKVLYDIVSPPTALLSTAGKLFLRLPSLSVLVFSADTEDIEIFDAAVFNVPESRFRLSTKTVTIVND